MNKTSRRKKILLVLLTFILIVLALPESFKMPVTGATTSSYNKDSFWYYPWGKSGTHKGVDIFAKTGTPIVSSTKGIVLYSGQIKMGGNIVLVLGPKWRLHYYAHLDTIQTSVFSVVGHKDTIGTVGTSGNAKGKPSHLHYSIFTLIPYVWRADKTPQGWKKMFYLNPVEKLNAKSSY
ncbi:M23 family metallopeptidase [Flavobacterium amniphilum]|uniref:M23 family metallopeptidase n=1 Tax=Flavobacterium amniphilum TaxID=1834035 RepID=UPI00202A46ED|nr:M23 family metallopeptidase [Flavobacterium amniphilum]MCL9806641.1 M23 family metallopeptidase [Flavobacterium amniphilum]